MSALLLVLIGDQTRWVDKTDLVAQPRFWPFVGLATMTGFAALHAWHLPRFRRRVAAERAELARWLRPFEFAGWFMGFVWVVPVIGFLPASLILAPSLTWRLGYRGWRYFAAAAVFAVAVVILFKGLLSVRIPGGALYEVLPGALRSFAIVWL